MLLVCRKDLQERDLERLDAALSALPYSVRWGRRGDRLVVLVERARADQEDMKPIVDDPAAEFVLRDPSEREIARIFSRRDLLDLALVATGVLAAGATLGPLALYLTAPSADRSGRADALVGRAESIPVNGAVSRVIDGREFLVVRRDEERFHALSATCTHSEVCLVAWDPKRRQIVCPCHRGVFDLNGNVVSGPPPRPLERREVTVRQGQIFVHRGPR